MLLEDFIFNITTKYRSKSDDENKVFFTDLSSFADQCKPDSFQSIYNHITQVHDYQTIPRMAKFWKFAKEQKLLTEKQEKSNPYWNVCTNCKAEYSKQGRGCPKCRCTTAIIKTSETLPEGLIEVQEDCFYCPIYNESVKKENNRKQYFTNCHEYGGKQDKHCSACQCRECCDQMRQYNNYPRETIEKYHTGELGQPWLREVQPLNETVKQMVDDMKKRPVIRRK